jgi:hypothetical protein
MKFNVIKKIILMSFVGWGGVGLQAHEKQVGQIEQQREEAIIKYMQSVTCPSPKDKVLISKKMEDARKAKDLELYVKEMELYKKYYGEYPSSRLSFNKIMLQNRLAEHGVTL